MRILLFAEALYPPAYIPRLRYFCSYFIKKGWSVDLVIENSNYPDHIPEVTSHLSIDYYTTKKGVLSKIEWGCKFLLNLFCDYKGDYFYRKSASYLEGKQFDLVFCSSFNTFPLTTAAKVAKKNGIPLFVDLRDIDEQSPDDYYHIIHKPAKFHKKLTTAIYRKINVSRRNKVLRVAAGVTTVSPWHVHVLSKYNASTYLIYNGFDENEFTPELLKTERFTISYFGKIHNEQMQNPTLLFSAIKSLNNKGIILTENTVVKWFLNEDSKTIIQSIANNYDLDCLMEYNSFVQHNALSKVMNQSSILLVLRNIPGRKRYFGIMTTKFFEAIGANRPILCIPDNSDNLSELIKTTKCGLVSSTSIEVENFLLDNFLEWQKTGLTKSLLSEDIRMNFSRKQGAKILEELFVDTLKKQK